MQIYSAPLFLHFPCKQQKRKSALDIRPTSRFRKQMFFFLGLFVPKFAVEDEYGSFKYIFLRHFSNCQRRLNRSFFFVMQVWYEAMFAHSFLYSRCKQFSIPHRQHNIFWKNTIYIEQFMRHDIVLHSAEPYYTSGRL